MNKLLFLMILVLSFFSVATAHKVNIFVLPTDRGADGEVYFHDGKPCADCRVEALDALDNVLKEIQTGVDGTFSMEWERSAAKLVVHASMGHRAEYILAPQNQKPVAEGKAVISVEKRVAVEVKKQMDAYEASMKIPKIIAGLGYILGIFGIWALLKRK